MLVQAWVQLEMKDPLLEELALREKLVFAATKGRLLKLSHLMVCVCVCVCVWCVCLSFQIGKTTVKFQTGDRQPFSKSSFALALGLRSGLLCSWLSFGSVILLYVLLHLCSVMTFYSLSFSLPPTFRPNPQPHSRTEGP